MESAENSFHSLLSYNTKTQHSCLRALYIVTAKEGRPAAVDDTGQGHPVEERLIITNDYMQSAAYAHTSDCLATMFHIFFILCFSRDFTRHQSILKNESYRRRHGGWCVWRIGLVWPHAQHFHWECVASSAHRGILWSPTQLTQLSLCSLEGTQSPIRHDGYHDGGCQLMFPHIKMCISCVICLFIPVTATY